MKVISLEFNELNFDFVKAYIEQGHLQSFKYLLESNDLKETVSESEYPLLEPWIQWVTAHTGKTFGEHGVFRLGDIKGSGIRQIWEVLEEDYNLRVAAISPMNAINKTNNASFFVPDPWTESDVVGSWDLKLLYQGIRQAVNDNAQSSIKLTSLICLVLGALPNVSIRNLGRYMTYIIHSKKRKWYKALFLDQLLTDTFVKKWKQHQPDFSSLFLNAGAHIQHHYMFSSTVYKGKNQNPKWYLDEGADPLLDVYTAYDHILKQFVYRNDVKLIISTGLSQYPNPRLIYQYRLNKHADFLLSLGLSFVRVEPRMSRDFLVEVGGNDQAKKVKEVLDSFSASDGCQIFFAELRESSVFCKICYNGALEHLAKVTWIGGGFEHFDDLISLASIENGLHRTTGYVVTQNMTYFDNVDGVVRLSDIFNATIKESTCMT